MNSPSKKQYGGVEQAPRLSTILIHVKWDWCIENTKRKNP
jgi:hypothetical protein